MTAEQEGGMPMFVPGPHESHDWTHIEGTNDPDLMCRNCEICTCHSPVASTEPCDEPIGADPMTAIDPLTYLDEVDAYLAVRDKFTNAGPNIVGYGDIIHGLNDVVLRVPQVRALSKALRAVLAIHPREVIAVHEGYGEEAWCPRCQEHYPCPTVQAIQAALAVNDEGGK